MNIDCKYWDLRKEEKIIKLVEVVNQKTKSLIERKVFGTGLRVFEKNWAFISKNGEINRNEIKELEKRAKIGSQKLEINKKVLKGNFKLKEKIKTEDVDLENLKDFCVGLSEKLSELKIKNKIILRILKRKLHFIDSFSSDAKQEYSLFSLWIFVTKKDGNKLVEYSKTYGDVGGFKKIEKIDWEKEIEKIDESLKKLMKATTIKGGKYSVILDPEICGTFVHECVGHASELDEVKYSYSILKNKINKKIANENFSLISDGNFKASGFYFFDDEGIKPKRIFLIKNGIFKNFMTNIQTSFEFDQKLTGNGRAEDYSYFPLVRMSNLIVEKGDYSFEELVEKLKNGLIVYGFKGGETDPSTGNFVFRAEYAEKVENGKITKILKNVTLSGNTLKIIRNVEAIGKERFKIRGTCGKMGQSVEVSEYVPFILVKNVKIGGK